MAGSGGEAEAEEEIWGTWEELLLASAVDRHGTGDWDSVASEVGCRTHFPSLLTSQRCEEKYHDLRRRFERGGGGVDEPEAVIPWLKDLRELRIAELRREVERYDVSIVSLQEKVERLREERERTAQEEDGDGEPDLERSESTEGQEDLLERAGEGDRKADLATGGEQKSAGEGSCNGSSDTFEKDRQTTAAAAAAATPEAGRESSDVQSSVDLSRARRRRRGGRRKAQASVVLSGKSSGGGGEAEPDEVSHAVVRRDVGKSQPLEALLETIRSDKYGSVFLRRAESQESARYRLMIRRHIDLDMMQNKLEQGAYTRTGFFRDILLLCNNALVFFPKGSHEFDAAVNLRAFVNKEFSFASPTATPSTSPPSEARAVKEEASHPLAPKLEASLLEKAGGSVPLIACRKRSSVSAKAAAVAEVDGGKDEKPEVDAKAESLDKRKAREKPMARGLRTTKVRGAAPVKSPNAAANVKTTLLPDATPEKAEKKTNAEATVGAAPAGESKKKAAATFMKRMSRGSPSSKGETLVDVMKSVGSGSEKKGKGGRKGKGLRLAKRVHGKEVVDAPVKRAVGRPPKRRPPGSPVRKPTKRAKKAEVSPPKLAGRKRGRR